MPREQWRRGGSPNLETGNQTTRVGKSRGEQLHQAILHYSKDECW